MGHVETGHAGASAKDFREAMARLGAAVSIITTDGPAGRHGFTASAVCSVTDSPPTVLVCVNRGSHGHAIIRTNGVLAINVLSAAHEDLSRRFAARIGEGDDRFAADQPWTARADGSPVLDDAIAALDCRIAESHDMGSHTVFYCAVDHIRVNAGANAGLVYFDRAYHALDARPAA